MDGQRMWPLYKLAPLGQAPWEGLSMLDSSGFEFRL